ncbi:MAG TPA: hypothetical protein VLL75_05480 [Vicinamibacteria bacterium]|nr:hypothetical protein [Vicinamibacteria bacterium]
MSGRYALRLDPWGAEYEGSIQLGDEEEVVPVDIRVERAAWGAVRPSPAPPPRRLAFVDGVRRVEHRLLIADADRTVFGLLGSFGVGAVLVDAAARVAHEAIGRAAVAGGGLQLEAFRAPVDGRGSLLFEPRSEPDNTPVAPVDGLQKAMRREEANLAERLSAEVDVVFLDGPLTFLTATRGSVVGFVKRLLRSYLDPSAHALLPRLEVGERTPLFLVRGKEPRYSWYVRIARGRAIESALTGVVRLETRAVLGLVESKALADLSAREMPRFASTATHDPRAPQNLFPIGGLEARLKHLLGDPAVVRRAIEARLHSEVAA